MAERPFACKVQEGWKKSVEIIWPEQVRLVINNRETLIFRDGDKLYFNAWYEDPDHREEVLVRSLRDDTILERLSSDIYIMPNGERWLVNLNSGRY